MSFKPYHPYINDDSDEATYIMAVNILVRNHSFMMYSG